jgi:hypothetical protein
MAHRPATVYKYIRIGPDNWQYAKPAYCANGKIKPNVVVVGNRTETHAEGNYYLRLHAGKGTWQKIVVGCPHFALAGFYCDSSKAAQAFLAPIRRKLRLTKLKWIVARFVLN